MRDDALDVTVSGSLDERTQQTSRITNRRRQTSPDDIIIERLVRRRLEENMYASIRYDGIAPFSSLSNYVMYMI